MVLRIAGGEQYVDKGYQFNVSDDLRCSDGSPQHSTLSSTHPFLETISPVGFLDAISHPLFFVCLIQQNIYPLLARGLQK